MESPLSGRPCFPLLLGRINGAHLRYRLISSTDSLTSNYNSGETQRGESARQQGWKHTVSIDPDRLLDQILEVFVEYNNWLTFRQLASRLTGDQSNEHLIAAVVR